VNVVTRALRRCQTGEADWVADWDRKGESCRSHFATLIRDVALVPTASVGVGLVAAALPEGIEVVVPDDEFTSVLFRSAWPKSSGALDCGMLRSATSLPRLGLRLTAQRLA
jgi:hypothetical protein